MNDLPAPENPPIVAAVQRARSGLRRDVQALLEQLDDAELLVPLARDLPDAPEGERIELEGELSLVPHLLPDTEGQLFAPLFTHAEPVEPVASTLEWTTDGEALKLCAFPARIALEMALEVIDNGHVLGLVIDPGAESELCLTRAEVSSLLLGRAVPLLAYVQNIPEEERGSTLVAEGAEPPPPELRSALDVWLAATPEVRTHRLERTFNPDRDLEPHLTLTLRVPESANRSSLFEGVTGALSGTVPPPGYLDVIFEPCES
ncbi:MAG TPA: SseB family protein [Polyangiaceae bacterium]|nr:SseB family protein [Polyangiaceae bacterium]